MTKSNIDLEDELYRLIKSSALAQEANGDIYQGPDERPDNSQKEDIEIIIIANQPGDIQLATISINIYTLDEPTASGKTRRNKPRLRKLARLGLDLFEKPINLDGYRITLESQGTYPEHQVHQHYYNFKLSYKYYKK